MPSPARSPRETRRRPLPEREAPPADRKKQILKAAVKVFAEKGYHGCRISDVAEEAGVAYGLVYHYFGNKEGLLRTIFETNWAVFAKAIEELAADEGFAPEKLGRIVDFLVSAFEQNPLVVKVLVLEFGRSSRLGAALHEPEVNRVFTAVRRIFEEGLARGEIGAAGDAWALSVLFLGALEAALASFVLPAHGERAAGRSLEKMRESLWLLFVRGLLAAPERAGPAVRGAKNGARRRAKSA